MSSQAEWQVYAANIEGEWSLCANCEPGASGKKLFRQYNFNRMLIGLPIVDSPINNTEFVNATGQGGITIVRTLSTGLFRTTWSAIEDNLPYYGAGNIGLSMSNPVVEFTADEHEPSTSGPVHDWILAVAAGLIPGFPNVANQTANVWVCYFAGDGAPGPRLMASILFQTVS
jgi:hypothetical protein